MNEDPAGFAGGLNPYAFNNNDPINGLDPTGTKADNGCVYTVEWTYVIETGQIISGTIIDETCSSSGGGGG